MAISVGSPTAEQDVLIDVNTTPLIDVMLVLLVMLIITIPIQTHAVKLDLPINPPPPEVPPQVDLVGVDFDGSIQWNGAPTNKEQLRGYLYQAAQATSPKHEVHVQPLSRNTPYGPIAEVMAIGQRVSGGSLSIGITGQELFSEYFQ